MADEHPNYDSMSDADFMNAVDDIPLTQPIDPIENSENISTEEPDEVIEETEDLQQEDTQPEDTDEESIGESEDSTVFNEDDQATEDTDTQDAEDETEDATDVDFETGYKSIMAPFKANGKQVEVESIDDVRRLMSMGAGYSKKMAQLKPHLKIIKSLQDNDLLDQGKLDHLIEISKNNPKAIAKLIKDGDIDPIDIDVDDAEGYEPESHEVSDTVYNLNEAIEAIRGNESFDRSIEIMGNTWDAESKEIIGKHPEIVGVVDDHIQNGVFDLAQQFIDNERTLGRLTEASDILAYKHAVQTLQESGVLGGTDPTNATVTAQTVSKSENPLKQEVAKKKAAKVKAQKKAAAPAKGSTVSKKDTSDAIDGLSDEEFLKQFEKMTKL